MGRQKLSTPNFKLHKLRTGIFEVRWEEGGVTRKRSTRTRDRAEAERARARIQAEVLNPAAPSSFTIGELLKAYEAARMSEVYSPDTLRHSIAPLLQFFEGHTPARLNDKAFKDYRNWRTSQTARTTRKPVKDSTAVRELNQLRGAISWGVRNGWQGLQSITVHTPKGTSTPRSRFLTKSEAKKLVRECDLPHLRLFVRLAIASGARMSAILQLTCDRVKWPEHQTGWTYDEFTGANLQPDPIFINFGQGRGNKNRSFVPIVTNGDLYAELSAATTESKSGHVIEYDGKPIASIAGALEAAYARAGIKDATVHTLKHTCCSWLVQAGRSYQEVGKLVGTTAAIIERHYGHLNPQHLLTVGTTLTI